MKYNAFISYRHKELDMEIAKKLHKGLETFHIPRPVQKKYGKKRIERVFRDQEELPIGSDLDDNITKALTESEYLIVVCSPRTPESYWVCKEIDSFIALHNREHVLAVLIEGEPADSFPPQLLTDEKGNPVEPLAADVRGATPAERDKKFKTELMRLVSPLIGCSYDELRQRHRERIMRRNMSVIGGIAGTAAVLGLAFGLYNASVATQMKMLADEKAELAEKSAKLASEKSALADEILLQYQETQKNQSRFYAEKSLTLLEQGKREIAALIAMEGLPDESGDRPYVPECEYALSRALHVYDNGNQLDYDRLLSHDQPVSDMKLNFDRKYLLSRDSGDNVYLWDTEDWSLIVKIPFYLYSKYGNDQVVAMEADAEYIYVAMKSGISVYDHEGSEVKRIDVDGDNYSAVFDCAGHLAFMIRTDCVCSVDMESGKIINSVEIGWDRFFGSKVEYGGNGLLLIVNSPYWEGDKTCISVIDAHKGLLREIPVADETVLRMAVSKDGHVAVLSCNKDFWHSDAGVERMMLEWIDPNEGRIWKKKTNISVSNAITFTSHMKIQQYSAESEDVCRIIVALEDNVYEWDAETGEELVTFPVSNDVQTLLVAESADYGIVAYSDGIMDWINTKTGTRLDVQRVESRLALDDLLFCGNKRLIRCTDGNDIYVLSYHTGSGVEELSGIDTKQASITTDPEGRYYVTGDASKNGAFFYYDKDGKLLYHFDQDTGFIKRIGFCNGRHMIADSNGIWYVDPIAGEYEYVDYETFGMSGYVTGVSFSDNGKYGVLWFMKSCFLLDLEEHNIVDKREFDGEIDYFKILDDGKKAVAVYDQKSTAVVDLETWKKTDIDPDGDWSVIVENPVRQLSGFYPDAILLNHDGTAAAMFCSDGFVRIVDLAACEVTAEIPCQSSEVGFANFTDDDACLLLQADGQPVYIWDIAACDYLLLSVDSDIRYTLTDKEHGLFICFCRDGGYVFTAADHTLIAYVPDAVAYFSQDSSFIQQNDLNVYRSHYMDYRALLEEAGNQLHGAALTGKEKLEYNIE